MSTSATKGLARALFEEAGDALFLFDPDTDKLLEANPMAERLTGLSRKELLRQPATYWFRFGGPGGKGRLRQAAARTDVFHSQEGYFLRTGQEGIWVPVNLTITRLHVQPKTLALVTARDVREQHESLARVKKAEAELRRVLDSVSDCLWSAAIDEQGRWAYQYFSPVVLRITGQPPGHFSSLSRWEEVIHPDDRDRWKKALPRLRSGQATHEEYRVVLPDGSTRWVRDSVQVSQDAASGHLYLDGILTDVTERKQADEELRKLNTFLHSIVENVPIMLFVKEAEGLRFTLHNKAGEELLGYTKEDLLGKNDYDFFPQDEAAFFIQKDREVLEGKRLVDIPEEAIQTKDGLKYLHTIKIPILDDHGRPQYLLGISEDVTARKLLEETRRQNAEERERYARRLEETNQALSESEGRYRSLTEATLDAIIVADGTGEILLFNPAAEKVFGWAATEIVGQPFFRLLTDDRAAEFRQDLEGYQKAGTSALVGKTVELEGRRKDGTVIPLELALSVFEAGGEIQFLAALRDLTERNRLRTVLFQTEKLASIGRLSAGVAHEINNPLAFVANNLTVLDRDCRSLLRLVELFDAAWEPLAPAAPELAEKIQALVAEIDLPYIRESLGRLLERTIDGVDRVARIIQNLRGHARLAPAPRQEVSPTDLFESCLSILQGTLRKRQTEVVRHYADTPKLLCVPTDLNQVVLNLLVNACQAIEAMPPGHKGRLELTTRKAGNELVLEVKDNGCGIAPENKPRLFDPFFTTKGVQEGTGLGLWISHSIVTAHGGRFEIDSEPAMGTSFRVYLPLG